MVNNHDLGRVLDDTVQGATHIVSSPDTLEELKAKGIPIEERFIKYQDYFDNLVEEKRKNAIILLERLPLLDKTIYNSIISSIYEEVRASFGLGIFTSTIFNAILLLEFALRDRLYQEYLKTNPKYLWEQMENVRMKGLIIRLVKRKVITKKEAEILQDFNDKFRNPYLHINVQEMITGIYADNVQSVNIKTGKVTKQNGVDVSKYRQFWFLAKKMYDKTFVLKVLDFCVGWTNNLLRKVEHNE